MSKEFRFSNKVEGGKTDQEIAYFENVQNQLKNELEKIAREKLIGEGQAAKVFDMKTEFEGIRLCAKMIRPELGKMVPVEQKRRQSLSPSDEFDLQDKLFEAGFPTPQPIAHEVTDR